MNSYIDIVLTEKGYFCAAPICTVFEGDLVCVPGSLVKELQKVVSVATAASDSEHIKMIERYIGFPLPKITQKYSAHQVKWEDENAIHE